MSREIRTTILTYYLIRAISAFGFGTILATYVTFLTKKGLTIFEAHLMNFFFFTTLLLFEVPTGAFADVFGRKLSFVLSCFLVSLSKFVYALAPSVEWFVVAEVISGLGVTFSSGAIQAWCIDRLHSLKYQEPIVRVFAREQQIKNAVTILSAMLGSWVAERNPLFPWLFTGVIMFVVGVTAFIVMKEDVVYRPLSPCVSGRLGELRDKIVRGFELSRNNPAVAVVVSMGIAQYFAVQAPSMQWQPYFSSVFAQRELGLIVAGMHGYANRGFKLCGPF